MGVQIILSLAVSLTRKKILVISRKVQSLLLYHQHPELTLWDNNEIEDITFSDPLTSAR